MGDRHDKYWPQLEEAKQYQDFIVNVLWDRFGLVFCQYTSEYYQARVGESKNGIEVKYQKAFTRSGNLWIEVEQKMHPDNHQYRAASIYNDDNAWLFVTGDYATVMIFAKKTLQLLYESKKFEVSENNQKTSRGFLLHPKHWRRYAAKIIYLNKSAI